MKKRISIICPVYNEASNIRPYYERLLTVLKGLDATRYETEILFTNNASKDATRQEILTLRQNDPRVKLITFSRNVGYQSSVFAGLVHASGDLFMINDVDCEDPPELLQQFLLEHERGFEVVYGIRTSRPEPKLMASARKLFYRLNRALADYEIVLDMAEFFLITRPVRDALVSNKSNFPFLRAEVGYVGFSRTGIPYRREARKYGKTHYNIIGNFGFAIVGILSSTTLFLRLAGFIGVPLLGLNAIALGIGLFRWMRNIPMQGAGYPLLFLFNLMFLIYTTTFLALYIARIYKNGLNRPLYFVDESQSAYR